MRLLTIQIEDFEGNENQNYKLRSFFCKFVFYTGVVIIQIGNYLSL